MGPIIHVIYIYIVKHRHHGTKCILRGRRSSYGAVPQGFSGTTAAEGQTCAASMGSVGSSRDRTSTVTWTSQNPELKFQGGFFKNASFEELTNPH